MPTPKKKKKTATKQVQPTAAVLKREMKAAADPEQAAFRARFFKTGPGEYGEGDKFRGAVVPEVRRVAKLFPAMPLIELGKLMESPWHEDRQAALFILTRQYEKQIHPHELIFAFYEAHRLRINNWDLTDWAAPRILAPYLHSYHKNPQRYLSKLGKSKSLWERRQAVLCAYYFARNSEIGLALELCRQHVGAPEELMHKAVGWMLREIAAKDKPAVLGFLAEHAGGMPSVMLSYAMEKFSQSEKKKYRALRAAGSKKGN